MKKIIAMILAILAIAAIYLKPWQQKASRSEKKSRSSEISVSKYDDCDDDD